jgi:hypothetical protein
MREFGGWGCELALCMGAHKNIAVSRTSIPPQPLVQASDKWHQYGLLGALYHRYARLTDSLTPALTVDSVE